MTEEEYEAEAARVNRYEQIKKHIEVVERQITQLEESEFRLRIQNATDYGPYIDTYIDTSQEEREKIANMLLKARRSQLAKLNKELAAL